MVSRRPPTSPTRPGCPLIARSLPGRYFHPRTFVLLVTTAPPDADQYERRLHSSRGWCLMEKNAAMAVKASYCLLDFSGYKGAADFGGFYASPNTCLGQMKAGREPPRSPPVFGEFMRTGVASDEVQFTVKEDAGLVSRLYQDGFVKTVNRVAAKESDSTLRHPPSKKYHALENAK